MFLTRNEVAGLIQYAIQRTASSIGLCDVEWKTTDELLTLIKEKNNKLHNLLMAFVEAYSKWFEFHEKIEQLGKAGNLDSDEKIELTNKISERDTTREALLKEIKNQPNQLSESTR